MIISETIQGAAEWLAERAGKVSASNFSKIITPTGKITTGETRRGYLYQLAAERISGQPEETYKNEWMIRGNELEAEARLLYEATTGVFVEQVGMVYLSDQKTISCSPDGLIGDNGGLEIKCPKGSTHVSYLEAGVIPSVYVQQVQGSMWVTGREWWGFMSYHPAIRPLIIRVERDEAYIKKLADAVESFAAEVEELVGRLG